jgi:hypothetical protein
MLTSFDGLFWLLAALVMLLFLQRSLHREIQAVLLIATRKPGVTIGVFSLIFLPGVFLHELSHFLMAKLLRVRTGRFSLIPRMMPNGSLQLGYVEAEYSDILRDSLVGVAPLLSGMLFIAFVAATRLQLGSIWDSLRNNQWDLFATGLQNLPNSPDFWIWFYLTFAISSTMMPSQSDRHAWLPLGLVAVTLIVLAYLAGAGPWMLTNLAAPFNEFLRGTALILLVSIVIHGISVLPFLFMHRILTRLTRMDIA